jgi:hypothetical protein
VVWFFIKCKAIPVTDRGGPLSCETSRLTDGGEVVSLTRRLAALYPPRRLLVLISVKAESSPVRLEGLGLVDMQFHN